MWSSHRPEEEIKLQSSKSVGVCGLTKVLGRKHTNGRNENGKQEGKEDECQ